VLNQNIVKENCWCKQRWESSPNGTKWKYDIWTVCWKGSRAAHRTVYMQSNWVITFWKGLNILCRC